MSESSQFPFSPAENRRYARHFALPQIGSEGQRKLKDAKVLCIGAGGLGSPLLLYLAAAGVGTVGICDFDTVAESNLQRQILFTTDDLGKNKAKQAKIRLLQLNPHLNIRVHPYRLTTQNALALFADYDLIADGSDNFPTRYLVNDACVLTGKPLVFGAVSRFEGQVSVFNLLRAEGTRGPDYRDLFPAPPAPGTVLNCAEAGVLGVLPGIIGSMQANEVIKIITGVGTPLDGKLFVFDAAEFTSRTLKIRKRSDTPVTELINYEHFCGEKTATLSHAELIDLRNSKKDFLLIDVRSAEEHAHRNIGGEIIPLTDLPRRVAEIPRNQTIVLYCQSGQRSAQAVRILTEAGYERVFSLEAGIGR